MWDRYTVTITNENMTIIFIWSGWVKLRRSISHMRWSSWVDVSIWSINGVNGHCIQSRSQMSLSGRSLRTWIAIRAICGVMTIYFAYLTSSNIAKTIISMTLMGVMRRTTTRRKMRASWTTILVTSTLVVLWCVNPMCCKCHRGWGRVFQRLVEERITLSLRDNITKVGGGVRRICDNENVEKYG